MVSKNVPLAFRLRVVRVSPNIFLLYQMSLRKSIVKIKKEPDPLLNPGGPMATFLVIADCVSREWRQQANRSQKNLCS